MDGSAYAPVGCDTGAGLTAYTDVVQNRFVNDALVPS
jgi:hypothetical protein